MTPKFTGPVGDLIKFHGRYSRYGRARWAGRLDIIGRLEGSTSTAASRLRAGLDLLMDPATDGAQLDSIAAVARFFAPLREEPTLPLHSLTVDVSLGYRSELPAGDALPRKAKKAYKRLLLEGLEEFCGELVDLERSHGLATVGARRL